ncbi:MAG: hypothetical protein K2K00_10560, partial [Muribaculaceae bacterium]|nr:hypothetical protein [Muribaculaceae bacterium]
LFRNPRLRREHFSKASAKLLHFSSTTKYFCKYFFKTIYIFLQKRRQQSFAKPKFFNKKTGKPSEASSPVIIFSQALHYLYKIATFA